MLLAFWCNASTEEQEADEMRSECSVAAVMLCSLASLREMVRRHLLLMQAELAESIHGGSAIAFAATRA